MANGASARICIPGERHAPSSQTTLLSSFPSRKCHMAFLFLAQWPEPSFLARPNYKAGCHFFPPIQQCSQLKLGVLFSKEERENGCSYGQPVVFGHTSPIWGVLRVNLNHNIDIVWGSMHLPHPGKSIWAMGVKTGLWKRWAMADNEDVQWRTCLYTSFVD